MKMGKSDCRKAQFFQIKNAAYYAGAKRNEPPVKNNS